MWQTEILVPIFHCPESQLYAHYAHLTTMTLWWAQCNFPLLDLGLATYFNQWNNGQDTWGLKYICVVGHQWSTVRAFPWYPTASPTWSQSKTHGIDLNFNRTSRRAAPANPWTQEITYCFMLLRVYKFTEQQMLIYSISFYVSGLTLDQKVHRYVTQDFLRQSCSLFSHITCPEDTVSKKALP